MACDGSNNFGDSRLTSLDAIRGFVMFWIIGGGAMLKTVAEASNWGPLAFVAEQCRHVKWAGFTFWDLIMPLFLFVVGTAIPFSLAKRISRGDNKTQVYLRIARRVVLLWLLSLLAKGELQKFDLTNMHFFTGVLQAIAVGYLVAAVIVLNMNVRGQLLILAGLLLLYWAIVALVPVPGFGRADYSLEGNAVTYIDGIVLGSLQRGTAFRVVSCLTQGCTVLLGALAGQLLRTNNSQKQKLLWLFTAGLVCVGAGIVWSLWLPVIKKIWTSSFVLYSAGYCFGLLGLFYFIIDVLKFRRWAFGFVVIGTNAIAVYVATRLFDFRLIADAFVAGKSFIVDTPTGGLVALVGPWGPFVRELTAFIIVWLILLYMYRKKTFVKV